MGLSVERPEFVKWIKYMIESDSLENNIITFYIMTYKEFRSKVIDKVWYYINAKVIKTPIYHFFFKSYWHYLFHSKQEFKPTDDMYYGARPNPGAGIGHQMANWIAGYYWATKRLNMKFVHFHFSTQKWDDFLGFGYGEPTVDELKKRGYKLRRLPQFWETNAKSIELIKGIMASYQGEKVMFWPPQDHLYREQYGVMEDIQQKFCNAPAREKDTIQYSVDKFNIVIHVRRTVIIEGVAINEPPEIRTLRWLSNDYYETVLKQVLDNINSAKPIAIWIFSTGKPDEFAEFTKYGEVHFCSDMDEYQSFAHLVFADLLITSKSSFSYKPALMNRGIKVCPRNFWHGYPDAENWILCENDGSLDIEKLKKVVNGIAYN